MPFLSSVKTVLGKVASSPITGKVIQGARTVADIGSIVGVPGSGLISKGLGVAERALQGYQAIKG